MNNRKKVFNKTFTQISITMIFMQLIFLLIDNFIGVNLTNLTVAILVISYIFLSLKLKIFNKGYVFILVSILLVGKLSIDTQLLEIYYLRVPLNLAVFGMIFSSWDNSVFFKNRKKINSFIMIYFVINMILYLSKNERFFKNIYIEQSLRYKGFLGDANACAVITLFLLVISLINIREKKSWIPTISMFIIICLTGSRGNTLVAFVLIITQIFAIKNSVKIGVVCILTIPFMRFILNFLLGSSIYNRMLSIGLSGNGRDILEGIAVDIVKYSNFGERIFGINITDRYIAVTRNISGFPYHDFAENSLITMMVFFGFVGVVIYIFIFGMYIKKIFSINNKLKNFIVVIGIFLISLNQDIILNITMFMFMVLGLNSLFSENLKCGCLVDV